MSMYARTLLIYTHLAPKPPIMPPPPIEARREASMSGAFPERGSHQWGSRSNE